MVIGELERHDHPFPGAGTLLEERPGTFLGAATQALQARRSGVSGSVLHPPPFTGDCPRCASGLHSCPPDRSPFSHYTLPEPVGIRIIAQDKDNNYCIADTRLMITDDPNDV